MMSKQEEVEVEAILRKKDVPKEKWAQLKQSQVVRQAARTQNEKKREGVG